MPVNNFSVGRDVTLNVVTPSGPLSFNLITGFRAKQDSSETMIKGINGKSQPFRSISGWSGSFSIERQDSTVDDYFAQIEANYYAGVNEQSATITETITEPNGSVSQYRFTGVLLKYDDAGEWRGDSSVKQSISFIATTRVKVA